MTLRCKAFHSATVSNGMVTLRFDCVTLILPAAVAFALETALWNASGE